MPTAVYRLGKFVDERRRRWLGSSAVLIGLLLAPTGVSTHHSFAAEFDGAKPVRLDGIVTRFEWTNPHAYFFINTKDEGGTVTNWAIEMSGPGALQRQGWTRQTLHPGDRVSVDAFPAKDGSHRASANAVYKDGKIYGASSRESTRG